MRVAGEPVPLAVPPATQARARAHLILSFVTDQHDKGAVPLRHTILNQCSDPRVYLLLHGPPPPSAAPLTPASASRSSRRVGNQRAGTRAPAAREPVAGHGAHDAGGSARRAK